MDTAHLPEPAPPHLRPSRFSHRVLQTAQLEATTAWYEIVLSARPMLQNGSVCFLAYDEEHHRVMIGRSPDGNEVELQVDDYGTREAMDAWFRTGASDRSFVSFPLDPETAIELHRGGVPEERIRQQALYR
jgi:hypothetical protein